MARVKATDLIDYTRASNGTALAKVSYGSELVTNGTFDTDVSGWTVNASGSLSLSLNRLRITNVSGRGGAYTSFATEVGKVYSISLDVPDSNNPPSAFWVFSGTAPNTSGNFSVFNQPAGSHEYSFVASSTTTYLTIYVSNSSVASYTEFDNISVKEVTFDQPDGTLQLFNHPTNIPRIEYDADGNLLGLLIEESRTNLLPYSEDFSNAQWSRVYSVAVSPSSETAPNGQEVAYELTGIESSDGDAGISEFISASASTTYTGTIWFKAKNASDVGKYIRLRLKRNGGTFVAQDESVQLTNSWVRHEVTLTLLSDNTGIGFIITKDSTQNTVNRADECLIYGAQLEQGSFPTSYIPTSGATATRAADVASIPVSEFGYNQNQGTLFAEYKRFGSGNAWIAYLGESSNTYISLGNGNAGTAVRLQVSEGGAIQASLDTAFTVTGTPYKQAGAFKANDFAATENGNAVHTDTSGILPDGISFLDIGEQYGNYLNGHIKSIRYFPLRLTNAKLQDLTK